MQYTNTVPAPTPVDQFRQLTRHHVGPLYQGEGQLISEAIEKFEQLSFAELVALIDQNRAKLTVPWELRRIWRLTNLSESEKEKYYADYAIKRFEAGQKDVTLLRSVLEQTGFRTGGQQVRLLDLGTGRGSFLVAAQKERAFSGWQFDGTDMDMASLLVNLKLNDEFHNDNYRLTCAYGERLPYETGTFNIVASFQTLEHVGNCDRQVAFIAEACRCLAPGGAAILTFPNRLDVLRPEPHVYIRFMGFVPQRFKDRLSLAMRGVPSSDIYPPDAFTLMRGLRRIKGVTFYRRSTSEFSTQGWKYIIARSTLYRTFCPWNVLVAKKEY